MVVNPLLVEGQIVGGTAQGIGGALLEELAYDAKGQLLTGSLMDYRAADRERHPACAADPPALAVAAQPARRQGRRRRRRGRAAGAIANAVCDALAPFGCEFNATPIRPEQIAAAWLSAADRKPRPQ